MIVLYIHQLLRHHPVTVFLSALMVLPWVAVVRSREEKTKKIKSAVYVETEHLDTTSMQFRASRAKLSFGAMLSKAWYVAFVCRSWCI